MQNDGIFELDAVSLQNLVDLTKESAEHHEARICEIAFIAESAVRSVLPLIDDGLEIVDILAVLSENMAEFSPGASADINSTFDVESFINGLCDMDKAIFAELIAEKFIESGVTFDEVDFLPGALSSETVAYVKSVLADEAFDVFSQNFSDPRVVYSDSFKEACFAVADGKTGYCILPLEEKGGTRIPGIYSLMLGLDLKIVEVTPVFGPEGSSDMKYALVSKGFSVPDRGDDTDRYLELRFDKSTDLGAIFSVSGKYGLEVYRINTMYSGASESPEEFYSVVFKDGGRGFSELLTYLAVFCDGYTSVGIYKNLE